MPTWIQTLGDLQQVLEERGAAGELRGDQLVRELRTTTGQRREVLVERTADLFELTARMPVKLAPGRAPALDLALANVNQRLVFPGLRRTDGVGAAYVLRVWRHEDGRVDAAVLLEAMETARQVIDSYEPALLAASDPEEVARG
jgi:hypothetical protein